MAKRYDTSRRAGETLEQQYKRLAKVADQRLLRLERLSTEEGFKNVKKFSYAKAIRDIESYGGTNRFNIKMPLTETGAVDHRMLKARISDIQSFIEKPTSNKREIVSVYKNRADSTNKSQGVNLTWEDYAKYYESDFFKKNKDMDSTQRLRAYANLTKSEDSPNEILAKVENNQKIDDDYFVDEAIKKILKKYGKKILKSIL